MAILTRNQVDQMWRGLYRLGEGKEQVKANGCPSESQLTAIFQAVEDFWESNRATLKAQMDLAGGRTLTVAEARAYAREWLSFKMGVE